MAYVGDVDDMGELIALEAQHPAQRVGEHIGAHVADVRIVVDRRPAGVDARLAGMDGREFLDRASKAVEQAKRRAVGHDAAMQRLIPKIKRLLPVLNAGNGAFR